MGEREWLTVALGVSVSDLLWEPLRVEQALPLGDPVKEGLPVLKDDCDGERDGLCVTETDGVPLTHAVAPLEAVTKCRDTVGEAEREGEGESEALPLGEMVELPVTLCEGEREVHLLTLGEFVRVVLALLQGDKDEVAEGEMLTEEVPLFHTVPDRVRVLFVLPVPEDEMESEGVCVGVEPGVAVPQPALSPKLEAVCEGKTLVLPVSEPVLLRLSVADAVALPAGGLGELLTVELSVTVDAELKEMHAEALGEPVAAGLVEVHPEGEVERVPDRVPDAEAVPRAP